MNGKLNVFTDGLTADGNTKQPGGSSNSPMCNVTGSLLKVSLDLLKAYFKRLYFKRL